MPSSTKIYTEFLHSNFLATILLAVAVAGLDLLCFVAAGIQACIEQDNNDTKAKRAIQSIMYRHSFAGVNAVNRLPASADALATSPTGVIPCLSTIHRDLPQDSFVGSLGLLLECSSCHCVSQTMALKRSLGSTAISEVQQCIDVQDDSSMHPIPHSLLSSSSSIVVTVTPPKKFLAVGSAQKLSSFFKIGVKKTSSYEIASAANANGSSITDWITIDPTHGKPIVYARNGSAVRKTNSDENIVVEDAAKGVWKRVAFGLTRSWTQK